MIENKKHILIIDDDQGIREPLKEYLESENFFVTTAKDSDDAKKKLNLLIFDLLIVDIMMPGQSGLELTKEIRKTKDTPIIFLTAMGEAASRIHGLETGGDDYVPKPFEPKELLLRINNILKRVQNLKKGLHIINFGERKVDLKKMTVTYKKNIEKINQSEKELLEKMVMSLGKVFQREDISKIINLNKERAVDVVITRLRQKIEPDPKNPVYLQTVRGNGYVLWAD
ncbi:MAG: response regulator transcription factor [Pelagibacteraceae bacterium]|jgi:two-component system phosphate regulon response regulator OmpR